MKALEPWLVLYSVPGIGPNRFRTLLDRFGSPQEVLRAPLAELMSVPRMDEKTARAIGSHRDWKFVERQLSLVEKFKVEVVALQDEKYPENLRRIYDPPPFLFVRGELVEEDKYSVAVVGCRQPTAYGRLITERISGELAEKGVAIVSGMARGIDSIGHRSALDKGGRTIAVLGCGVDVVYPPENRKLMARILGSGAVMSEFPMGTKPEAPHFPRRNRVISGLSLGVIIVEADRNSGALITAEYALEQNREVFAVPGNVTERRSRGTNWLIKEGAKLVESIDDVLEELGGTLGRFAHPRPAPVTRAELTDEERRVYEALGDKPTHIDLIAKNSGLSSSRALSILLALELNGLVKQFSGKLFVST